jgi:ABC-type nickel/cobalt efflux system permease component RcnA
MEMLIYVGVALTLAGVALLAYCIVQATKAKKLGGSDEDIRARLQKVVALNLVALMISAIGLGAVTIGSILS